MSFEKIGATSRLHYQFILKNELYEFICPNDKTLEENLKIVEDIAIEIKRALAEKNNSKNSSQENLTEKEKNVE